MRSRILLRPVRRLLDRIRRPRSLRITFVALFIRSPEAPGPRLGLSGRHTLNSLRSRAGPRAAASPFGPRVTAACCKGQRQADDKQWKISHFLSLPVCCSRARLQAAMITGNE